MDTIENNSLIGGPESINQAGNVYNRRPQTTGGPSGRGGRRTIITVNARDVSAVMNSESTTAQNRFGNPSGTGSGKAPAPMTIVFDSMNSIDVNEKSPSRSPDKASSRSP